MALPVLDALFGNAQTAASDITSAGREGYKAASDLYGTGRSTLTQYGGVGGYAAQPLTSLSGYGETATKKLSDLLTGDPATQEATLKKLPGYQFSYDEAMDAVNRAAAAGGKGYSGQALTEAQKRATNLANQYYFDYAKALQPLSDYYKTGQTALADLYGGTGKDISTSYGKQADVAYGEKATEGLAKAGADYTGDKSLQGLLSLFGGGLKTVAGLGTNTLGGGLLSSLYKPSTTTTTTNTTAPS